MPRPLVLLTCLSLGTFATAKDSAPTRLEVMPSRVILSGPRSAQRVIVVGVREDGSRVDLTDKAVVEPRGLNVSRDPRGRLVSAGDGLGEVSIRAGSLSATLPVEAKGIGSATDVGFRHEVEPVLTKLGCNMGACHGGQHGKGGFKLSLLGFEAEPDYDSIVKSAGGRRASPSSPEESLLLLKPTLALEHGGGRRMRPNGREYELIRSWLEQGAPPPSKDDPTVTGLSVLPAHRVMAVGETQHLVAMATFSDGSTRDVTDDARFDPLNDANAAVSVDAVARATGSGETSIMVRYQGHAAMARITVPYGPGTPFEFDSKNPIDALAAAKWRALGLAPSPTCTDAEFLRRAMLDAIGTTPSADEIDVFLANRDPNKRAKLVDRLLDRPEYVDFWTLKWGDLLRVETDKLGAQGMLAFNLWLRESFRENRTIDRMVDELVTAQGSIYTNGPANYFRVASSPDDLAETTAQVFLGVRLQCAKCHHHPFEAYGQDDYYGLAAYFARIRTKNSGEFGLFGQEQVIYVAESGEVRQPRSGKIMAPRPLRAAPADDPGDRRRALSRWITAKDNPWLSRNVANRYWGYLMGRGLVNPIDDLRDTNPASNPELLDALARSFADGGFDLKSLLRTIMTSRVYGLSSLATPDNRLDQALFTHYSLKRLTAEQMLDALNAATGTMDKFAKRPAGTRAISLPDTSTQSYFLDTFGRPTRATACECERGSSPTLGQALHLMNSELVQGKLAQVRGRLANAMRDPKLTDETLVQTLYRATFGRPATAEEVEAARDVIREAPDRAAGAQDLFWGLLNSKEFLFNH